MRDRMRAICAGLAASFDVEIDVDIRDIFSVLVNSEPHARIVADVAREVVGVRECFDHAAAEDGQRGFRRYAACVARRLFLVGARGLDPLHNPGFVLDDAILPVGASLFARLIETRMPRSA